MEKKTGFTFFFFLSFSSFRSLSFSLCVSSSYLDFPTFFLTPFLKKKVTSDEKTPKDERDAEEEEKERERKAKDE